MSSRVVALAAFVFLGASAPTLANAGTDGLAVGTSAPQFMLPVVNDFTPPVVKKGPFAPKGVKWGPGKWTGSAPDENKKLVIMSFFATYCDPCKKEMPELSRLYDAYKDQGLGIMLVSIDKGDEQRDQIISLAKENKVAFPVMHDRFQVVARRYVAERLPYMLFLDPSGTVKTVHVGYTEELKANLENEVRGHLGLEPLPATAAEVTDPSSKEEDTKKKPAPAKKPKTTPTTKGKG
jgi:thiol-disulfide isomerase/thioredoxin